MKRFLFLGAMTLASMPLAHAALLTGTLNTTGTAIISLGSITFLDNDLSVNGPAAAQLGSFQSIAGTAGSIMNITNPPDATGPLSVPDFITFQAAPNISFTLTFLLPGIDGAAGCVATPAAAGQVCTPNVPAQSPFNLQNTSSSSSSASFDIRGIETDSSTGQSIAINGTFTTPITESYQQILATVEGGGSFTTAFSAQFTTAPEPGTWIELGMGLGLVGISSAYRKRFKKN